MKTDIYVCSKPLQYFNARNIPKSFHPGHRKVLVLITYFYNADDFCSMIKKYDNSWSEVVKVSSVRSLYFYLLLHRFDNLIYGFDTSTCLGIIHLLKKYDFYILEEGLGTYLSANSRRKKNAIQTYVDKITGVSTDWGHTRFVKGAFVYYPNLYKTLRNPIFEPKAFEKPFVDKVSEDIRLFLTLSRIEKDKTLNICHSRILLYITGWEINQMIIDEMLQEVNNFDYLIIKPHPHIREFNDIDKSRIVIFKSNIMVEFVLSMWLKQGNKVTIFHEGSTALFYYRGMVSEKDLSSKRDEKYNRLIRGEI